MVGNHADAWTYVRGNFQCKNIKDKKQRARKAQKSNDEPNKIKDIKTFVLKIMIP